MERCSKCHKPTICGNLCDDCKRKEEQRLVLEKKAKDINIHNYIVNQSQNFGAEFCQGFIWAPKQHKGRTYHYWTRLKDLKVGDKIFNSCNGKIEGISIVTKEAVEAKFPEETNNSKYQENGWIVECKEALRFLQPIELNLYMKERKDMGQYPNSPFDENGEWKEGYLFPLSNALAELFEKAILKLNYKKSDCVKIKNGQIVLDGQSKTLMDSEVGFRARYGLGNFAFSVLDTYGVWHEPSINRDPEVFEYHLKPLGFNIENVCDVFFKVDNVPDGWVKIFDGDQDVIIIKKELLDKIDYNYVEKTAEWVERDKIYCLNQNILAEALSNKLKNSSSEELSPVTIIKYVKK